LTNFVGFPRPNWITGGFHGGKNVDNLYTRNTQRQTIAYILSSQSQADFYIHPTNDWFLCEFFSTNFTKCNQEIISRALLSPRSPRSKNGFYFWFSTSRDILFPQRSTASKYLTLSYNFDNLNLIFLLFFANFNLILEYSGSVLTPSIGKLLRIAQGELKGVMGGFYEFLALHLMTLDNFAS
jgi:hypothetical protein